MEIYGRWSWSATKCPTVTPDPHEDVAREARFPKMYSLCPIEKGGHCYRKDYYYSSFFFSDFGLNLHPVNVNDIQLLLAPKFKLDPTTILTISDFQISKYLRDSAPSVFI